MLGLPTYKNPEFSVLNEGSRDTKDLSSRQRVAAEEMLREAELRDFYSALMIVAKTADKTSALVGGFESDDLIFNHNPDTGRTSISIDKRFKEEIKAVSSGGMPEIGEYDYPEMVMKIQEVSGTKTAMWGWIRAVSETEQ